MSSAKPDRRAFGRALAKLRIARGLTQQEIAARIPTYYTDATAYGRIERGQRRPDRAAVIAILVRGLLIVDVAETNALLELAEYQPLDVAEQKQMGLKIPEADARELVKPERPLEPELEITRIWQDRGTVAAAFGAVSLAGLILLLVRQHYFFALSTSILYAGLYAVSIHLETAFEPRPLQTRRVASITFGFVLVTSSAALATDGLLVGAGNTLGLPVALAIFLGAAVLQFFVARTALPEAPVVRASFQAHTAQSAHLKNTGYFLLLVILFWVPPFHAVATFTREARMGHTDWVRQVLTQPLMLGRGVISLDVSLLLLLLFITLLISLLMAHALLGKLQTHPRLNAFTNLFYLRALVYLVLCLISIGWYAYRLSELG